MFVRFRETSHTLQLSLIETRRVGGKVRHEHVATLGAVPRPASTADRIAFWSRLHHRLAKLSNRIDAEAQGKILGSVHAKISMPTADEQRALQMENAKADVQYWESMQAIHVGTATDHKGLIGKAQQVGARGEAEAAKASSHAAAALS
ncbi:hypothetical protein SAMN05444161_0006 [Rhizobiales bacterium GAS191]|nr:hypothetical protein SAMN05444161_0006 [Rhizobiales bacterium GAS191]